MYDLQIYLVILMQEKESSESEERKGYSPGNVILRNVKQGTGAKLELLLTNSTWMDEL